MIKSILAGRDREALPILLHMHAPRVSSLDILDVTYNKGTMWRGLSYSVTSMDIDLSFGTDIVGNFTAIPVNDASFDVLVFDPPHLPVAAASEHSSKLWERRYGITANREKADSIDGYSVVKRLKRLEGIDFSDRHTNFSPFAVCTQSKEQQ